VPACVQTVQSFLTVNAGQPKLNHACRGSSADQKRYEEELADLPEECRAQLEAKKALKAKRKAAKQRNKQVKAREALAEISNKVCVCNTMAFAW
jgi:hypothetical protein